MRALLIAGCVFVAAASTQGAAAQSGSATQPKAAPKAAAAKVALPAAIEAAFKKAYPSATIKHVSKEKENGVELYEVESVDGTQPRDLVYKADGTLVEYEEAIAASAVPQAVTAALKARYPTATVTNAEKFFKDGSLSYELALKGAKIKEATLTPEGKWVSPK